MLRQRVITAAVLIPVVILTTYFSGTAGFAAFCALFICMGAWEWSDLAGFSRRRNRIIYCLMVAAILAVCYFFKHTSIQLIIPVAGVCWWGIALLLVMHYQRKGVTLINTVWAKALAGLPVLVPAWFSLVILHAGNRQGMLFVIFLLVLIWVADSAAFFSGRRWGKNRLSSRVSPGKSWEGVLGAILAAAVTALLFLPLTDIQGGRAMIFLLISILTVAGSVLGDLFESLLKRSSNRKDSGTSIPGHGGVLDRIDSLTAAGPVFVTSYLLLRHIP